MTDARAGTLMRAIEPGDVVTVLSKNNVRAPAQPVTDRLEQAGGPKKEADRRNMFLLRADGSVVPNKRGWFGGGQLASLSPLPGDSIVVPEDLYRTTLTKDLKDWTQISYQFELGAAALKVIGD